jgi:tRNA-binding EMAP/Myf-like protein
MSEFRVEVVRLGPIEKHPNADTLGITQVHGGYPVIVKLGDFQEGDLATYIPVDAIVDGDLMEFAFLGAGKKHRIKAKKIRGVFSMGLLVRAGLASACGKKYEGEDVQEIYSVEKFVPPSERDLAANHVAVKQRQAEHREQVKATWKTALVLLTVFVTAGALTGKWAPVAVYGTAILLLSAISTLRTNRKHQAPKVPVYDIEGYRKHKNVFLEGETVSITEKIHGCNARFVYTGGKLHCGSRNQFRYDANNVWARIAAKYKLTDKLKKHKDLVLFGEIYGKGIQDLHYGANNEPEFVAFDAMNLKTGKYLDVPEFTLLMEKLDIPTVPYLSVGPWSSDLVQMAEGETQMPARHVREGIVIKPMHERETRGLGRTFLKYVGEGYHLRA